MCVKVFSLPEVSYRCVRQAVRSIALGNIGVCGVKVSLVKDAINVPIALSAFRDKRCPYILPEVYYRCVRQGVPISYIRCYIY